MPVFLFTQIEKFAAKWEKFHQGMSQALALHDSLVKDIIAAHKGRIVKHTGEGIFVVFDGDTALNCAVELQLKIASQNWGEIKDLRIGIGIHAGEAEVRGDDYFGPVINRTARLMQAAWGGQVLLSREAMEKCVLPEGAETKDLGAHVFADLAEPQQIYELNHPEFQIKEFPPIHTLSVHTHNLPVQVTRFIGRQEDITSIKKTLMGPSCRILNIIGLGGIGKTRLALQVAAELVESFKHGVYFIPLASLASASMQVLVISIAEVLKFSFSGEEELRQQLLDYLREKEMLLVMDNFDHLAGEAPLLSEIVDNCKCVKILVTSRTRLQIKGEWIHELKGLEVESSVEKESSAVRLFAQSAQRVKPDFKFDDSNKGAAINICRLVDGLPLAIELAASWVRTLNCYDILKEIGKSMDFLATTVQDSPSRHQSLRAVFDYSWQLLSAQEKKYFAGLSIFHNPFLRNAAQEIVQVGLPELSSFVDQSLLRRNANQRYEILPLLKQYAAEKLKENVDEKALLQIRFCRYYANLLNVSYDQGQMEKPGGFFDTIVDEIDNIRTAWLWALELNLWEDISKMLKCLYLYYQRRSYAQEGRTLFNLALSKLNTVPDSDQKTSIAIRLQNRLGKFEEQLGEYARAFALLEKTSALARETNDFDEIGFSLIQQGAIFYRRGNFEQVEKICKESLNMESKFNDRYIISRTKELLGHINLRQAYYEKALIYYKDNLRMNMEIDDIYGIATTTNSLGNVYLQMENYDKASECYEKSLELLREISNQKMISRLLNNLGNLARNQQKYDEAEKYLKESLEIKKDIGEPVSIAFTLGVLGFTAYDVDDYKSARDYFCRAMELLVPRKTIYYIFNIYPYIVEMAFHDKHFKQAAKIILFMRGHEHITSELRSHIEDKRKRLLELEPDIDLDAIQKDISRQSEEQFFQGVLTYLQTTS